MLTGRTLLPLVVLTLVLVTGCSRDRHEILSTNHLPATVMVIDTLSDTILWSMDVPAGQRLVWDFSYADAGNETFQSPNAPAGAMDWWLFPASAQGNYGSYPKSKALDRGTVALPGTPIRTEIVYRDAGAPARPAALISPEEAAAMPPVQLELEVLADGTIVFDGQPRKDEQIGDLFRSLYGERRVVITGKPGTPKANLEALKTKIKRPDLVTIVIPAEDPDR